MTRAVCLSCGAFKWGAFTRCNACGHHPDTAEDQARHMLVSDPHMDEEALVAAAERIERGEDVELDPDEVAEWSASIASSPVPPVWFALLVGGVPAISIGLVVLLSVYFCAG